MGKKALPESFKKNAEKTKEKMKERGKPAALKKGAAKKKGR